MSEMKKRPVLLTIVCVMAFIGVIISFPSIFSPYIKKAGDFYPAIFGCIIASNFIAIVGVWNMKQWGFTLFLIASLLNQIAKLSIDNWSSVDIVLPIVFVGSSAFYYSQMSKNL